MRGLAVTVFRSIGRDLSLGGLTAQRQQIWLEIPPELAGRDYHQLPGIPSGESPYSLLLVKEGGTWKAIDPGREGEAREYIGPMFGGNYVDTGDSRKPWGHYAIPVHDRWETERMYRDLSR